MISSRAASRHLKGVSAGAALVMFALASPAGRALSPEGRRIGARPEGTVLAPEKDAPRFRVGSRWLSSRTAPNGKGRVSTPSGGAATRPVSPDGGAALSKADAAVSGQVRVLVAAGLYSDFEGIPADLGRLQTELFDGPWRTGTMSEYWDEVSGGLLDVDGDVRGWVPLANPEVYYTGNLSNGTTIGVSKTDEMIEEVVAGLDPSVDFGMYDNDGPDGIPNSGDDDGYVDILVIVHPTAGAECGDYPFHMVSHSYQYSLWNDEGLPLETSDPAAGGGFILVDDYNMAPSVSCDGGLIEIGVFCHEFGHLLGLPDLYDLFGRSGIGYWGLMGTGEWNKPESPAHLCGWSKERLGWAPVVDAGWAPELMTLDPAEEGGRLVRMVLPTERFRRRENVAPVTGYSLICGYTGPEASARGYRGDAGYGNGWDESMERYFQVDGERPVTLGYGIAANCEEGYDFARVVLEGAWGADTLAEYTGTVNPVNESIDLTSLLPEGDCRFRVRFCFSSDYNFSDEDGYFDSMDGWTMNVDNISVSGGGLAYSTDLEEDAGGWYCSSPPAEYFLVERRARRGLDSHLPGEGLIVYHAENSIAFSANGNTGGPINAQARGVVVEEADGRYDMINYNDPINHGEASDPFPGSGGNLLFSSGTSPSSRSNGGDATPVSISSITSQSAVFKAGMPSPEVISISPASVDKASSGTVEIDIRGSGFLPGTWCALEADGTGVQADSVEWMGEGRVLAEFSTAGLYSGDWDLRLTSGDGQQVLLAAALDVSSVFGPVEVVQGRDYVGLSWTASAEGLQGCRVWRKQGGGDFTELSSLLSGQGGAFAYTDSTLVPAETYAYRIEAVLPGSSETLDVPGEYTVEAIPFTLLSVWPNPFHGSVSIAIFLPEPALVTADVFDAAGRRVDRIARGRFDRGDAVLEWSPGATVGSGVYFCLIRSGGSERQTKLVLIR